MVLPERTFCSGCGLERKKVLYQDVISQFFSGARPLRCTPREFHYVIVPLTVLQYRSKAGFSNQERTSEERKRTQIERLPVLVVRCSATAGTGAAITRGLSKPTVLMPNRGGKYQYRTICYRMCWKYQYRIVCSRMCWFRTRISVKYVDAPPNQISYRTGESYWATCTTSPWPATVDPARLSQH